MSPKPRRELARRALAGLALPAAAAVTLGLAALLARRVAIGIGEVSPATSVDELVVLAVTSLGVVLALWLGVHLFLGALCAFGAACGRRWHAGERLVAAHGPGLVRRGVALAVGASMGLGGVAMAAAENGSPTDLGWVPTTGVVTPASSASETSTHDAVASADEASSPDEAADDENFGTTEPRSVRVEAGDSLWSLTESLLGSPGDAAVAAGWPELFEANREVIGADPDLIHPGQELVVPATLEEQP